MIDIVFATDNAFTAPLSVALLSLFKSNAVNNLNVTIILIDVAAVHIENIRCICARFPDVKVVFHKFDLSAYGRFPISRHITEAAYARLFTPEILPLEVSKALYLDCDIIVLDDLTPLWETDLTDKALAGVENPASSRRQALGIPATAPYVNSGVLLLNLDYWRQHQTLKQLTDFIAGNPRLLYFHDQDAINACLHKNILLLPSRWNVQHTFYLAPPSLIGKLTLGDLRQIRRNPGIVHFTGPTKPWEYGTIHPFKKTYAELLRLTPYFLTLERRHSFRDFCIRQAKLMGRPVKRYILNLFIRFGLPRITGVVITSE